eukprot:g16839.t1
MKTSSAMKTSSSKPHSKFSPVLKPHGKLARSTSASSASASTCAPPASSGHPASARTSPALSPKQGPIKVNNKPATTNIEDSFKHTNLNQPKFWDIIAPEYDEEILSTIDDETSKHIVKILDKYSDKGSKICCDFGCGVGKYLPALSKRFRHVVGLDFSPGLLQYARLTGAKLKNVSVIENALSLTETEAVAREIGKALKLPAGGGKNSIDFGVCANVLLTPDRGVQMGILKTLHYCMKPKGVLYLLVPALESHLFGVWAVRHGPGKSSDALNAEMSAYHQKVSKQDLIDGVVKRGDQGVRTQHYTKEQIVEMCRFVGFRLEAAVEKAEFTWDTEVDFECMLGGRGGAEKIKKMEKKFANMHSGVFDWIVVLRKE